MSSSPTSTAIKRACDACHRRKVRCIGDGSKACRNCASSNLYCTFNAIPQKKGPKGSRAKVITELRETQRLAAQRHAQHNALPSEAYLITPGLLSTEIIELCTGYFFDHLYSTQPILHREQIAAATARMYDGDIEAYVLLVSLCGYMFIQLNISVTNADSSAVELHGQSAVAFGQSLVREATRVRKSLEWVDSPTVLSVITSFFLFGSYFCLDRQHQAWFQLREATTIAQLLGMHEEKSYQTPDLADSARRRRLYWLLFVTERAYSLQQRRPLTLHATINLPTLDEADGNTAELRGFIHLARLFRPFDDTFVGLWNKVITAKPSGDWLSQLQRDLSESLPTYLECTEPQVVDLRLSQLWLKTMVWQLSISHGALSSLAADNAMSFTYPIEVSRDLVAAASNFTQQSMEVHGIGLVEKLFDVACTLTDVISCVPSNTSSFDFGPRDYLCQIINLISKLRGGEQRYLPLLTSKIQETMPTSMGIDLPLIPINTTSTRSEATRSPSSGHGSTPFENAHFSNSESHLSSFGSFSPTAALSPSGLSGDYQNIAVTNAVEYGGAGTSAPMQMFTNTAGYHSPDGILKFESNG